MVLKNAYKLTGFKHIKYLRKYKPEPEVELNPETAEKAGLKEGDWVYIETKKGKIKQKLSLDSDLDPRVVFVSFGWWFPEDSSDLFRWDKSNLNLFLDNDPAETATGTVETRGIPCRVHKV
ncbi:molybdopterin dinucleotide binding domain-containing protein [Chloroflexota bacterium]